MEGLSASLVLTAVLLGVVLVAAFDVFCLLRLGTAGAAPFLPRFAWAVLIVGTSPIGGVAYLLTRRLRKRRPEAATMGPGPLPGYRTRYGPAHGDYGPPLASPESHAAAVVAIGGAVYLVLADQDLAAAAVATALVIIKFLTGHAARTVGPTGTKPRAQADTAQRLRRGHGPLSASPVAGTKEVNLK
jgi:hypothetical protein